MSPNTDEKLGQLLGLIRNIIVWGACAYLIAGIIVAQPHFQESFIPRDDTDTPAPGPRSGLALYIDHGTGCQYLATRAGVLTLRIDGQGRHVGCHIQGE